MDTRFGCMMAGSAVLAPALAWSPPADAEELGGCDSATGCLTTALEGLVSDVIGGRGQPACLTPVAI